MKAQAETTATVEGPVEGGKHGWPFAASLRDVAALGYEEVEYFLAGTAKRYRDVNDSMSRRDGYWEAEEAGQAEFRTRMLVYRPRDPARFNGTVILNWNNVTAGYDLFGAESLELFEGGFAVVFLTTQKVGIEGLPPVRQGLAHWDPERYGTLFIPSDDYAYDVFTQAALAVGPDRDRDPDPLGGLNVQRVIGWGASQSAGRLATYLNAIQPLTQALDGCILAIYFGRGTPLEVGDTVVNINERPAGATQNQLVGSNLIRDDLDIPVFVVNSELEAMACYRVRQPDTDTFRYWEAAGTCHVSQQVQHTRETLQERDGLKGRPMDPDVNAVPMGLLYDAVFHHMQRWMAEGIAPPVQPKIEFAGEPPQIVRDEHGIATGGIRLPQVEVPLATNSAIPRGEGIFALLGGSCEPFPADKVRALYGDEAAFLAQFEAAAQRAMEAQVLRPRDVPLLVEEARGLWPGQ
ncbi:MAG: alpha/beta hydrolase domain-containing protein [Gammaproteobacteria bacterium]|nr:alpha/beta hydrolase domain-containing protein [Gammaproteobacteria bacterium]